MATLILNANTASPITVNCQRAGKGVPRRVGSKSYSFAGAERSSVRGQAKVIPITTSYVDTTTEALIQNAGFNGASIPCSGDILGNIQTVCSFENVVSNMMPGLPGFFEMSFTLNEVQPSNVLLRYSPGDTITGESFTRSTTAKYYDAAGVVQQAAINIKRDGHYVGGVRSLLLEDTRQNICLQSETLGTTWTLGSVTIGSNVVDAPDTAVSGDKIQEDSTTNVHRVYQPITCASVAQSFSVWVRAGERTKCVVAMNDLTTGEASIGVDLSNGSTFATGLAVGSWTGISARVETGFTNGWYRVSITGTRGAGTQTAVEVYTYTTGISYAGTTGSGVYAWGGQLEIGAFATSYIPTTTVAVTRGGDSYSLPFTTPPQEMSVYAKWVESGTSLSEAARIFAISTGAGTPEFFAFFSGGFFFTEHISGSTVAAAYAAPALGVVEEMLSRLYGDGSIDNVHSENGGAAATTTQSAADPLATAWAAPLCWLNSAGAAGFTGYTALQSFKIVAGMRSLAEMRAA